MKKLLEMIFWSGKSLKVEKAWKKKFEKIVTEKFEKFQLIWKSLNNNENH